MANPPHAHPHPQEGDRRFPAAPSERMGEGRDLFQAAGVTALVMVLEAVGGFFAHSLALVSDAAHMLTDVSALVLSLVALRLAARPADQRRTYGYYRLEILAALTNSAALMGIAFVIAWQAWQRIAHPTPVHAKVMAAVAAIGMIANTVNLSVLSRHKESLNVRAAFLHVAFDLASSAGVMLAALLILLEGWTVLDPVLSAAIAVLIFAGGIQLAWEAVDVLLEAVPPHIDLAAMVRDMEDSNGVVAVHDLHVWTITSGLYALSAHVVVRVDALGRNDSILELVKQMLRERYGIGHTTLQIESEAYAHVDEAH